MFVKEPLRLRITLPENGELSTWSEWMPHLTQQLGDLLFSSAGNVKKGAAEVGSKIKDGIADPMKDLGDALCDNVDLSGLSAMLGEAGTDIGNLFGGNLYSTGSSWISRLISLPILVAKRQADIGSNISIRLQHG